MKVKEYIKRGIWYQLHGIPNKIVKANIYYTNPSHKLDSKHIVITGGSDGIGFAMAEKFVAEGAKVVITGRNDGKLISASKKIGCSYIRLDMRDFPSFANFFKQAENLIGKIDCLVNNAGISLHEKDITEVTESTFDMQFNTNLKGPYFLSKEFIRYFLENGLNNGNLLFTTSERGEFVDDIPYGLTKAAINSLVKGLASRLIKYDIRVNAVGPGITVSHLTGLSQDNLYNGTQMNERNYLPMEMAESACFFLSDISNCMTGQILVCNEGKSINSYWR